MEAEVRQCIPVLVPLSVDDFLTAMEAGLQHLSDGRGQTCVLSHYVVEGPKDEKMEAAQALCRTLEFIGHQGGMSDERLAELLTSAGLQEDRTRLLLTQRGRLEEMAQVQKQLNSPPEDLLDLQWKFGVVAGSSMEGEVGRTFVQVNFISQSPDGARRNAKLVEMSLEKFYDFLHQLEKCKASLEHARFL